MKLFFLHIPKSAGTSFYKYLQENVYRDNYVKEFDAINSSVDTNIFQNKDFICGHVDFLDIRKVLSSDYKFVTVLRDPVDRCVSWYKFTRMFHFGNVGNETKDKRLEDIPGSNHPMSIKYCHNMMTYMLGDHVNKRTLSPKDCLKSAKENISTFDDVLFFDTFKEDVETFINKYEFNCDINKLRKVNAAGSIDVSQEAITNLKKCNGLDMELFKYAKELFGNK